MNKIVKELCLNWSSKKDNVYFIEYSVGVYKIAVICDFNNEVFYVGQRHISKLSHTEDDDIYEYTLRNVTVRSFNVKDYSI